MRRWIVAPLIFAAAIGLTTLEPQPVVAQQPEPVAETLKTADGVELHTLFHATNKTPSSAPVVVFLYPPGPDREMIKGEWKGLAKALNAEGYHVVQFDWRGHGKSTTIKDKVKFWQNNYLNGPNSFNSQIRNGPPVMPVKNDLFFKDLKNPDRYLPAYLNDLAAVRLYIDTKNDGKELNSSTIYIVGAGETAGLGMAWITAEWNRPATMPGLNLLGANAVGYEFVPQALRGNFDEAGADFGGAVWLTAKRPSSMSSNAVKGWVSGRTAQGTVGAPKLRDNTPMLFLYADKDTVGTTSGKAQSEFFFKEVLVADPKEAKKQKLEVPDQMFLREVKDAQKLDGLKLLGTPLKVEDTIVEYFKALQKVRQKIPSKPRNYATPYFIAPAYFDLRP